MFKNIAKKLKALAKVICWVGIVLSVLAGLLYIFASGDITYAIAGVVAMLLGILLSWVGSFVLYGFGQIVENTDKMAANSEK